MNYDLTQIKIIQFPKDDFNALFQEIKKRPQLLLPRYSIFDFYAFYFGYIFFRDQHNISPTVGDLKFEKFIEWVKSKCEVKTNMSWANLIFAYSSDEKSALDYLFKLYDQFILNEQESFR
jgi:hypothetical protein